MAELAGVEEPLDVLAQTENRGDSVGALVRANAFEGTETIVKRVREDVHLRVVPVDELTVHPDLRDLLDHARHLLSRRRSKGYHASIRSSRHCTSIQRHGRMSTRTAPTPPWFAGAVAKQSTCSASGGDESQLAISSRKTPRPPGE